MVDYLFICNQFIQAAVCGHTSKILLVATLTDLIRTMEDQGDEQIWQELTGIIADKATRSKVLFPLRYHKITVESFREWLEYLISIYHDLCLFVGIYELTGEWRDYQVDISVKYLTKKEDNAIKQLEFNLQEEQL